MSVEGGPDSPAQDVRSDERKRSDEPERPDDRRRPDERRPIDRRLFLLGGFGVLGAAGAAGAWGLYRQQQTRPDQTTPGARAPARTRPVFEDNFDDPASIDWAATGQDARALWFLDLPFGWKRTPSDDLSVANSVLTISQSQDTANWGLSTVSSLTGRGRSFKFGHFEARMRFDPTLGTSTIGWPSFWSMSTHHLLDAQRTTWSEIDFFEAYSEQRRGFDKRFHGTVHHWGRNPTRHYQSPSLAASPVVDYTQWHRYGCTWRPGLVRWFLDDAMVGQQSYSTARVPSPAAQGAPRGGFAAMDTENPGMALVLGTGIDWPLQVDWVKVWA